MSHTAFARTARIAVVACAAPLLTGCAGNATETTQTRGLYVTDQTIALLKASNTDKDWLFLLYGLPGKKTTDKATGNETWSWDFYKAERKQAIQQSAKVFERTMYAEFDPSGSLVRAWATNSDESMYE